MQYRTLVRAEVPRVRCPEHGVQQVRVPWAESQSRLTALFEAMVIDCLPVARFAAVARQCRLRWDQVAGIQNGRFGGDCLGVRWPQRRWWGWTRRRSNGGTST